MAELLATDSGGNPVSNPRPIRIEFNIDGSATVFIDPRLFQATIAGGRANGTTVELMTKILITRRFDEAIAPSSSRETEMQRRISAAIAAEQGGESV